MRLSQKKYEIQLSSGVCIGDAAGLEIPVHFTHDDFEQLNEILFAMEGNIQLWIGDALNAMPGLRYGDLKQIAAQFGGSSKTLSNWLSICERVDLRVRRNVLEKYPAFPLSLAHYGLVQSLDQEQQEEWLMQAAREQLSVASLRRALQAVKAASDEQNAMAQLLERCPQPCIDPDTRALFVDAYARDDDARRQALALIANWQRWLGDALQLLAE